MQVINGYELNSNDEIIILTAYPVAGYGSFTATSRSQPLSNNHAATCLVIFITFNNYIIVQTVAGYESFVALSHFVDY